MSWGEWAGILALTILVFILPVYAVIARIGFAFLKNTVNDNHRYVKCVVYGVLTGISLCMAFLLVSLFQEAAQAGMPLLFFIYSLFYLSIAAGVGAAVGAIVGRALGYEGDIRIGPPL